jgi:hypothetical protein
MPDKTAREIRWEQRRTQIVEELTPVLRKEHPALSHDELLRLVDTQADLRLVYERFGREP